MSCDSHKPNASSFPLHMTHFLELASVMIKDYPSLSLYVYILLFCISRGVFLHLKFLTKKYSLIEVKHFQKILGISCSLHLKLNSTPSVIPCRFLNLLVNYFFFHSRLSSCISHRIRCYCLHFIFL